MNDGTYVHENKYNDSLKKYLKQQKERREKIIYIPVEDLPDGKDPYQRENHQRNAISRALVNAKDDDLVIISDLDEIPNPNVIKNFQKEMRFAVFKQNHYYYKFNLRSEKNPFWHGSRICVKRYLKSPQWLRDLKFKKRPFWRLDKFRLNNILEDYSVDDLKKTNMDYEVNIIITKNYNKHARS